MGMGVSDMGDSSEKDNFSDKDNSNNKDNSSEKDNSTDKKTLFAIPRPPFYLYTLKGVLKNYSSLGKGKEG